MTETNGPIDPLQSEIAELRNRIAWIEQWLEKLDEYTPGPGPEPSQSQPDDRLSCPDCGFVPCERHRQPDEPPKYGPQAQGSRSVYQAPDEPQGVEPETQWFEPVRDFAARVEAIATTHGVVANVDCLTEMLRQRDAAIRADERRTYQAAIEAERAVADALRAKLEATERERQKLSNSFVRQERYFAERDVELSRRAESAERERKIARAELQSERQECVKWKARNEREGHEWKRLLEAAERERDELDKALAEQDTEITALRSELDRARAVVETARLALQHDHVDTDGTFDALREALRAFDAKGEK
jgi:hypothetical protein